MSGSTIRDSADLMGQERLRGVRLLRGSQDCCLRSHSEKRYVFSPPTHPGRRYGSRSTYSTYVRLASSYPLDERVLLALRAACEVHDLAFSSILTYFTNGGSRV